MLEAKAEWTVDTPLGALLLNGETADYNVALNAMSPTSHWKTTETSGTAMVDAKGVQNGVYVGGVTFGPYAPIQGATRCIVLGGPGTGQRATISAAWFTDVSYDGWTWQVWGASFDVTTNARTYLLADGAASGFELYIATGGIPTLTLTKSGETTTLTGPIVVANAWHSYMVRVTESGYLVQLIMDGVVVAETNRANAYQPTGSGTMYVGVDAALTSSRHWQGYISNVSYFATPITIGEMRRLHTVGRDFPPGDLILEMAPKRDVPMRSTVDSFPLSDGGVVGDQYADPAMWVFEGCMLPTQNQWLQLLQQLYRGRINSLMRGEGTVYFKPTGYSALQFAVRRGERPDTSKGGPAHKPFQFSMISPDPRVYSQERVRTNLTVNLSGGGITSPITSPITETSTSTTAVTVTNSGDAFTPPIIELVGPFTSAVISVAYTYNGETIAQSLTLSGSVNDGVQLTVDVAADRIYRGATYSSASNAYDLLTAGSVMWELAPGANAVDIAMGGATSASSARIRHRHGYLP